MKKQILFILGLAFSANVLAQMDTIFTFTEQIPCTVKEVSTESIKYSYPGEELLVAIYKNSVKEIHFKSGRVQAFSESVKFKSVNSVDDYESVTITKLESEIKGLYRLGEVSSKAKGTTGFSSMERVKKRAYAKLKMGAALMGANIVYLTDQNTRAASNGGGHWEANGHYSGGGGNSTSTDLSGVTYTNELPSYSAFTGVIGEKRYFVCQTEAKLWDSGTSIDKFDTDDEFVIHEIINENGEIFLEAKLEGVRKITRFKVVNFTEDSFNIFYRLRSTIYNIEVKI